MGGSSTTLVTVASGAVEPGGREDATSEAAGGNAIGVGCATRETGSATAIRSASENDGSGAGSVTAGLRRGAWARGWRLAGNAAMILGETAATRISLALGKTPRWTAAAFWGADNDGSKRKKPAIRDPEPGIA